MLPPLIADAARPPAGVKWGGGPQCHRWQYSVYDGRCEQLLPLVASFGMELVAHPEFAGGLVSALLAEPSKRLKPRIAAAAVLHCLLPLSGQLPHVHAQLRRLMLAQWQLLHAMAVLRPEGESDLAGIGGILGTGASGGAKPLSLLQAAAREANERGVVGDGPEEEATVDAEYARLQQLVPRCLGERSREEDRG